MSQEFPDWIMLTISGMVSRVRLALRDQTVFGMIMSEVGDPMATSSFWSSPLRTSALETISPNTEPDAIEMGLVTLSVWQSMRDWEVVPLPPRWTDFVDELFERALYSAAVDAFPIASTVLRLAGVYSIHSYGNSNWSILDRTRLQALLDNPVAWSRQLLFSDEGINAATFIEIVNVLGIVLGLSPAGDLSGIAANSALLKLSDESTRGFVGAFATLVASSDAASPSGFTNSLAIHLRANGNLDRSSESSAWGRVRSSADALQILLGVRHPYIIAITSAEFSAEFGMSVGRLIGEALELVNLQGEDADFRVSDIEVHAGVESGARSTYSVGLDIIECVANFSAVRLAFGKIQLVAALKSVGIVSPSLDPSLHLKLTDCLIRISVDQFDSFVRRATPSDSDLVVPFDFDIAWSAQSGVSATGGLSIDFSRDLHTDAHLRFKRVRARIRISPQGIDAGAFVVIELTIGPLRVSVVDLGVVSHLRPAEEIGNLGPLQAGISAVPPSGLSLSVSSGPIQGGGFIAYDDSVGRYTGAIALCIGEINLSAIGVLDVRLSDTESYSFLIAISAAFTPVQLGMGFTLNGVGGLCGIQRSVALPALQAGVRIGNLTPLLFPRDPVGQASQLVTGLQRIFPPTTDRYVFGPMFRLGWGTPTIVTVDLGIILQLPAPMSVALIGTVNMIFPDQSVPTPIVAIHIDIAGSLDTGAKTLAIDASLRDSKIAGYDLTGDMALRLAWGDQPDFTLSIGGFHKAFKPPPGFPELRRLSLGMVQSAFRLTCSAFLAVTSNTFQIGARAELYAEAAGFNVFGYVEFDALITFSPFSFRFDFAAGLALRRGTSVIMGISVAGMIAGPNPWHVQGSASISILFFEVSVSFDKTFGDTTSDPPPETITPWTELEKAVRDLHNWVADPEPDAVRVVSCAAPPAADDQPRLDPLGRLGFHQRVLPLGRRLTKFGEKRVPAPTTLSLGSAQIGETAAPAFQPLQESFAPGQFQQLSDAEKLSRPSFESMTAGALLSSDAWSVHAPEVTDLAYRVISIQNDQSQILSGRLAIPSALDLETSLAAVAGQAPLEASADRRYAPPRDAAPLAALDDEHVVVVDAATLQPAEFHPDPTASPGHAYDAIARRLQEHPEELGTWRVVPMQDARMSHAA